MYCKRCGRYVKDGEQECPYCKSRDLSVFNEYAGNYRQQKALYDRPSFGYALLGFLFPLIGLILYLVWKDEYPLRASSCIKGVIVDVVVAVIAVLLTTCGTCMLLNGNFYY